MKFTVIISAFNKHELTKVHVKECMNSTLIPNEIIVVNDHGDPCLKEMLQELDIKTKLIYAYIIDDIPWNYTGARNLGACLSTGDFLISEDNDNIPDRTLYADMLKYIKDNPQFDVILAQGRPALTLEDMQKYPLEEWRNHVLEKRSPHDDSFLIRRETYFRMKGYDEKFAGQYAWVCTDWKRRLLRADIKAYRINTQYFTVIDDGTRVCECGKTKEERTKHVVCPDCGFAYKRRSYRNYELARRKTHIQPSGGMINFTYEIYELQNN